MDALHAAVRIELKGIHGLLRRYLHKFQDVTYQKTFPWVDQIVAVTQASLIETLEAAACAAINDGDNRCWMCIPEIIDWTRVSRFRFGFAIKTPQVVDVELADFLESLGPDKVVTPDRLASRRVHAVDSDGNRVHSWPARKCLYCEVERDGATYILSNGLWCRVNRDFVGQVDEFFASVPRLPNFLPSYQHQSEAAYCASVAAKHGDEFVLLDQKTINIGGRYGKLELCDLFSASKDLIHVKRYGASSVLSHLFAQGAVSGEAFRYESSVRQKALELLPAAFHWTDEPPSPAAFRVVFGIVSSKTEDLRLPFFSRVNLRQTVKRLQAFSYRVALTKISVEEVFAKTKLYD
jgi:uncharacterized protein (TIGR04141 family)